MRQLSLPGSMDTEYEGQNVSIGSEGAIVIVGANGSGKTRLGTWIELESEVAESVRRISAQKSLSLPASATSIAVDQALQGLLYGSAQISLDHQNLIYSRRMYRWGGNRNEKPYIHPLSDFEELLTYLFSDANETNAQYVERVENTKDRRIEPSETKLRATKRVWEGILPHRKLVIGGGKVETQVVSNKSETNGSLYNASEMSDGERVIFYLIGQALSAQDNSIIVIDEPELHLHRSIQARLWDAIEAERPDCLFVYLTHDLDFAASRISATKVWLESYDGKVWNWQEVNEAEGIPEQLYLEILGGRKPVLFCEGDKGSLDYFLFQKAYPDFTVAPCGNAHGVIQATRSFSTLKYLHSHSCCGIVDRDFREDTEVEWLRNLSVYVLDYSEIENVLLTESVLREVAKHQCLADSCQELIEKAKDIVFREMENEHEILVSSITAAKVDSRLKKFDSKAGGRVELRDALANLTTSIHIEDIYADTEMEVKGVVSKRDYAQALRLYNNKGLIGRIEPLFGFARKGMPELIKRLASKKDAKAMLVALQNQLPIIEAEQLT